MTPTPGSAPQKPEFLNALPGHFGRHSHEAIREPNAPPPGERSENSAAPAVGSPSFRQASLWLRLHSWVPVSNNFWRSL
jgi:hypothetical protein